ncbi:unnamed protein product [Lymnaea stagnalis]|uniref:Uncharacterized protein n=1 Tax=Lymnaea stagnalis TaxID=6523 RepID=A0AAV2ICM3_LYMST
MSRELAMDLDPFYMKESKYMEERLKQLTPWERLLLTKRPIIAPDGYIPNSVVRRRLRFAKPDSPPPPWRLKPVPDFDPRYLPEGWKARKDVNLNGSLNLKVKEDVLDTSFRGRSRYDGSSKGASVVTPVPLKGNPGEHAKMRFDYQTGALRSKMVNFHVEEEDSADTSDEEDERQIRYSTTAQEPEDDHIGESADHSVGESMGLVEPTSNAGSQTTKKKRSRRDQKKRKAKVEVKLAKIETKEAPASSRKLTRAGLSLLQRIVREKLFPPGVQPVLELVTSELIKLLDSMDDSVFTSVCEYLVKIFHDLAAAMEHLGHIETLLNIQLKSPSAVISKKALVTLKQLGLSVKQDAAGEGVPLLGTADLLATQELRFDTGNAGKDVNGRVNARSLKEKSLTVEKTQQGANFGNKPHSETMVTEEVVSTVDPSQSSSSVLHGIDVVINDKSAQRNEPVGMESNSPHDTATDLASSEIPGRDINPNGEGTLNPYGSDSEQQPPSSDQNGQRSHSRGGRKTKKSASRKPHSRKISGKLRDKVNQEGGDNIEETQNGSPSDIREEDDLEANLGPGTVEAVEPKEATIVGLKDPNREDLQRTSEQGEDPTSNGVNSQMKGPPVEHVVVLPAMSHLSEPFGSFRGSFDGHDTVRGKGSLLFSDSGITGVSREMTPSQALCSDSLDDLGVGKDCYMGISSQAIKGSDSMIDRVIQSLSPIHSHSHVDTEHEVYTEPGWKGAEYRGNSEENYTTGDGMGLRDRDGEQQDGEQQDGEQQDDTDLKLGNSGHPKGLTTSDVSDGGLVNLNQYHDRLGMVNMTDYMLPEQQDDFGERAHHSKKDNRSRPTKSTAPLHDDAAAEMFEESPINDLDWRYLDPHGHGTMSRRSTIPKLPSLDPSLRNELILTFWDGPAGMSTWEDPLLRTREKDGSRSSRAFTTSMTGFNPRQQGSHCEHYKWATKKMHHYISISNFLSYTCLSRTMADLSTKVHQKTTYFGRSWQQTPVQFLQR